MLNLSLNLEKDKLYILSISGGLDSMALLHYFYHNKMSAVVVSFDHQTRDNTKEEVDLVKKISGKYNYPFYSFKLTIDNTFNFHNQAHILRYKHLTEIANKYNTNMIVTAHHFDDLIETIIMRIYRGGNVFSYSGMAPFYINQNKMALLKPFLFIKKNDLIDYIKKNNISYMEDESNFSVDYFRNYIRLKLLPKLRETNPNLDKSILGFYNSNNYFYNYLNKSFNNIITRTENEELLISLTTFQNLTEPLKLELLTLFGQVCDYYPRRKHLLEVIKKINSHKPNLLIPWGLNYYLSKQYNTIKILFKEFLNKSPNIIISHNKPYNNSETIKICYNKLDFPIVIRKPKPDDYLSFSYGRKKLSKYLIDEKIDLITRNNLRVITDNNGLIIAVYNIYINRELGNGKSIYISIKPEVE